MLLLKASANKINLLMVMINSWRSKRISSRKSIYSVEPSKWNRNLDFVTRFYLNLQHISNTQFTIHANGKSFPAMRFLECWIWTQYFNGYIIRGWIFLYTVVYSFKWSGRARAIKIRNDNNKITATWNECSNALLCSKMLPFIFPCSSFFYSIWVFCVIFSHYTDPIPIHYTVSPN